MFARLITLLSVLLLFACQPPQEEVDRGLLDMGPLWPYPSAHLESADDSSLTGVHLDFGDAQMPVSTEGDQTVLPTERLHRLDGFPTVGTIVLRLPGQAMGGGNLPSLDDLDASMADDAPIRLLDLERGVRIPYFAELDAFPDITPQQRVLLIRPQRPLPAGGHVGVAITGGLKSDTGDELTTPGPFKTLIAGDISVTVDWLRPRFDDYQTLFDQFSADGLVRSRILLAWDFHVASSEKTLAPFDQLLAAKREVFPAEPSFDPGFTVEEFRDRHKGGVLPEGAWRAAQITTTLPSFVSPEYVSSFDEHGLPVLGSEDEVLIQVLVPESVRGAAAGTVPVLVFGHGLLAAPDLYLDNFNDDNGVVDLVNRLGMIAIGTEMRGLTRRDLLHAIEVARDFGRFSELTDLMLDGVTNTLLMERLPATAFAQLSPFEADDGSGSMIDSDTIRYYGISLGGIEGTVYMGNAERTPYGVLHVPGSMWSTMLERSSNWASFEVVLAPSIPEAASRQLSYAVTQNFWDPVDPAVHAVDGRLLGKSALWQMSIGDEQVPNFTTDFLVRAIGAPLVTPAVELSWDIDTVPAPLGPDSAGMFQMDSQLGRPTPQNRPAEVTEAHTTPRKTDEHKEQIRAFFEPGAEGTIIAPCGDGPCVFDPE